MKECWTVLRMCVKFSCITMSLFIVKFYIILSRNGNKRLSVTECQCYEGICNIRFKDLRTFGTLLIVMHTGNKNTFMRLFSH